MRTKFLKPYTINKAKDGKTAKVNLYGEIVEEVPTDLWTGEKIAGLYIELKSFLDDIETLSDMDEVSFYINSVGGSLDAGISIFNKIRALSGSTTTIVDGLAASAASIVAQAGDRRLVSLGSQTMVHCASVGLLGYYNNDQLKDIQNMLKSEDKRIAELLADRTGRESEEILKMMKNTTWMTADEAVKEGYADEVVGKSEPVVDRLKDSSLYVVNGIPHNLKGLAEPVFANIGRIEKVSLGAEPKDINPSKSKKEEKSMDINTLKAEYPELAEEIRNEATVAAQAENDKAVKDAVDKAIADERKRLQEIDSIAKSIGADLVNEAKYGESPMTAQELSFKALQNQQEMGAKFLTNRAAEQESAGVNNVMAEPKAGTDEDTQDRDIADGAALLQASIRR